MQKFSSERKLIQFPVEPKTIGHDVKIKLLEIASTIILSNIKNDNSNIINIDYEITQLYNKYLGLIADEASQSPSLETQDVAETYTDDYIICLEDGERLKMLKRHLRSKYHMSFEEYKRKWNLPKNYPSVCKNYSTVRKNIATKKDL